MHPLKDISLYVLPVVLTCALAEGVWMSARRPGSFDWKSWACSLGDLVGRFAMLAAVYVLGSPLLTFVYQHRVFDLAPESVETILLLFVSLEFFYYWYHRGAHTIRWFWMNHSVHHSPNQLVLSAAYRLGWMGKIGGNMLFFTPLVFLGFEPQIVLMALSLNLLYQFWIHAAWIPKLGWLEYVLNTPSAHRVHHARNPEYLDANFGGVLIVFDRLFGTYIEEKDDVPCEYGLVTPVRSHNPIVINFMPWIGLAKDVASARSLKEAWLYMFAPPGWRPNGQGLTTRELRAQAALSKSASAKAAPVPQPVMT
jgi:sterol desaturase/sphingolipid hydroxylase (fatty acid hydroxylase superfamily)